jgi:hypothetical protein
MVMVDQNQNRLGPKIIRGGRLTHDPKLVLVDPKLIDPKWKSQKSVFDFGPSRPGHIDDFTCLFDINVHVVNVLVRPHLYHPIELNEFYT